ncbi:hypothetical protein [Fibrella forsythiae]|uniref:Uncharacterized protein n=1 Tax=Fibrella forsythiae TaxID=2817061 RepID=A0ABS3JC27_9BACT|nr:hypothetical protein [Fibrella forsythiae]MBO0947560.1 hypothetical protein [Fibrella forsythiae]
MDTAQLPFLSDTPRSGYRLDSFRGKYVRIDADAEPLDFQDEDDYSDSQQNRDFCRPEV